MRTEKIQISRIDLHQDSRRDCEEDYLMKIVASIREHGQIQPVRVQESRGRYKLIDGAYRIRALQRLGYFEVLADINGP